MKLVINAFKTVLTDNKSALTLCQNFYNDLFNELNFHSCLGMKMYQFLMEVWKSGLPMDMKQQISWSKKR